MSGGACRIPSRFEAGGPVALARALRVRGEATVLLDGDDRYPEAWMRGAAWRPRELVGAVAEGDDPDSAIAAIAAIERRWAARRANGGGPTTGIAVVVSYEATSDDRRRPAALEGPDAPTVLAVEVDAMVRWAARGVVVDTAPSVDRDLVLRRLDRIVPLAAPREGSPPARSARTSLPREAYVSAVSRIRERIRDGDVYQANLTQMFTVDGVDDRFEAFARMARATPAPRTAFVEVGDVALASVSPEVFLDVGVDRSIETWPIKGTRPRRVDPDADRAEARDLSASEKDRAELTMIVDLERNDLGRICEVGSIQVPGGVRLRSFPAVHHLVARVRGRLRHGVGLADMLRATFPGGSISGAPKRRAMEILSRLEPGRRGWYTGALLWLADDGTARSSILIRSAVLRGRRAWLGAGGGVVAESDPLREWRESNDKARAPAAALGFVPEDAR